MATFRFGGDGFIIGAGGDMSRMAHHLSPNPVADEPVKRTGAYKGRDGGQHL